ncbi:MAG: cache domain-containing protein [Candidatus Omnitrophota bacterium]
MKTRGLKTKILLSYLKIIVVLGISIGLLGFYLMKKNVLKRAQDQVTHDLNFAHSVYFGELNEIKNGFKMLSLKFSLDEIKQLLGLDYVFIVNKDNISGVKSEIVGQAFTANKEIGGTRLIEKQELKQLGENLYRKSEIEIKFTPKALPTDKKILDKALALEYVMPLDLENGHTQSFIYGGKIINRDFVLVDKIRNSVFENKLYDSKPLGTVTIFLDDTRIATNVLDNSGKRAIGTRVSRRVYENVVEKGKNWLDRAFVVTNWYLTGYEPIRDVHGKIIGILYVGLLEKPFIDMFRNLFFVFLGIILSAGMLSAVFAFILAGSISRPLTDLLNTAEKISGGNLGCRAKIETPITELNQFAESFNNMAERLNERDKSIKISHEKIASLNKNYLDLIGFVSHELKGILSSVILNAYSVRDGFLGMINFKQRKALDLVVRNLDYLASTVKNFLSLSRIEKGEIILTKREVLIKEDIFDVSIDEFSKQISDKGLRVINNIPASMRLNADPDLFLIVANNLISNAIKYGILEGEIIISAQDSGDKIKIEVYNDGIPFDLENKEKLFKKFSRVNTGSAKKIQGTGLGLFITKEIVEKHEGSIWMEARETGTAFIIEINK